MRAAAVPESLEPSARAVVAAIDPELPLYDVRPGNGLAASAFRSASFATLLMASFAAIGLALTSIGLYGVLSYDVLRRTREIGVRIALGATRGAVLGFVARRATVSVATGVAIGVVASLAVRRAAGSLLFGADGPGPWLVAVAAAVMLVAAWLAAYLPARRAASIEPVVALRGD
jgi:ABC-type antimicrobial peptide transport system permease subunit